MCGQAPALYAVPGRTRGGPCPAVDAVVGTVARLFTRQYPRGGRDAHYTRSAARAPAHPTRTVRAQQPTPPVPAPGSRTTVACAWRCGAERGRARCPCGKNRRVGGGFTTGRCFSFAQRGSERDAPSFRLQDAG